MEVVQIFGRKISRERKTITRQKRRTIFELHQAYLREKQRVDREILMHSKIIAMTTSGAARYQDVLKEVAPRVIIVEEAAEVLEAHIVATLNSNCEHLILIGDHKQLEPKPAVFELAEKYNLSLSMFERMINIGLPYVCLERQHRMRPEISQLVRPVYEKLVDNENVLKYEDVLGIHKNLYFISHDEEESKKDESQSYWNNHEASYIQCLSRYLLLQGYKTSQITILTPYSGQMFLLREMMPRREFDGENRVCVALSRAKIGLYVIGNFDNIQKFSRKCKLWGKVIRTVQLMGPLERDCLLFVEFILLVLKRRVLWTLISVRKEDVLFAVIYDDSVDMLVLYFATQGTRIIKT
uniref:NFX1-type zinc finger-containing protein 1-like isoform X3 n=1 Tax=Crassostrea virginica TaxID=6565 RepID=A0A8B8DWU5_CRAVI|nr:NFX1-type zinc finger-containing protein 1-like isoform X3 [Crassostrea virginica]